MFLFTARFATDENPIVKREYSEYLEATAAAMEYFRDDGQMIMRMLDHNFIADGRFVHGDSIVEIVQLPENGNEACNEQQVDPYYLYILMRHDCPDLNPGKAVAQGTHAANQMVKVGREHGYDEAIAEWEAETGDGFGTCIVVSASYQEVEQTVAMAGLMGLLSGVTHDPEYPLRDGHKMKFLPMDTCGFVFGRKTACRPLMKHFDLMA